LPKNDHNLNDSDGKLLVSKLLSPSWFIMLKHLEA